MTDEVDLIVTTFSKSLASIGGCVAGPKKVIEYIKIFGRSIIFSASCPPANTAAALKALEILQREPERCETVRAHGRYMKAKLAELGYEVGASESPVLPIVVGEDFNALQIWKELFARGIYTNPFIFPAADKGRAIGFPGEAAAAPDVIRRAGKDQIEAETLRRAVGVDS